nr:MAG TPA: single-stranded-DNA-specific exonuclease RecJ [Caudoviricetes sp.]
MKFIAKYDKYDRLSDDELLRKLLIERGVEDVDTFLHLNDSVLCDAREFKNIKEGLELIDEYIYEQPFKTVCLIVDSDTDGNTSSAFCYRELQHLNPNLHIIYVIHEGKQHGIVMRELEEQTGFDFDLLVVPDAGSSDYKQCKQLTDMGKDILILDHHIVELNDKKDTGIDAIRINNQDGEYNNPTLSGVGVVYKFFNLYEKVFDLEPYSDTMLDLVALGQIADVMDMRNHETRYITLKGLELLNSGDETKGNKFIKAILKKQEKRIGNEVTISKLAWNVAPLINATVRVGTMDEKTDMFKAFIDADETREYQPRRKHKEDPKPPVEIQDMPTYMARVITNIKARQDKQVKAGFEEINDKIKALNLQDNKVIMVDGTKELDQAFTGYVAGKIASYYKRPALVIRKKKDGSYGGSARNYSLFEYDDLRGCLNETGLGAGSGHENAFGISIPSENTDKLLQALNNKFADASTEDVYRVDYAIPIGRLKEKHILQVGQWENMWGCGLNAPLFAITDVWVDLKDINLLGEKQNFLKISKTVGSNRIDFVCSINAKDVYNKILGREERGFSKGKKTDRVGLDIIGKFEINDFNGKQFPQINIVDFTVLDKQKKEIKF